MDAKSSGSAGYSTESGRHSGTTLTDAMRAWEDAHGVRRSSEHYWGDLERAEKEHGPSPYAKLEGPTVKWPTPMVPNGGRRNPPGTSATGVTPDGRKKQVDLAEIARRWSTPRASDGPNGGPNQAGSKGDLPLVAQAAKWATPIARDHRSDSTNAAFQSSPPLGRQVLMTNVAGATGSSEEALLRLNPLFVAALLALPCWWTAFDVSETPSSHRKRRSPSKGSQKGS